MRLTYEYLNMDFSTFKKTEKIAIQAPNNGTQFLKKELKKYDEANCILVKNLYGFLPWKKIFGHKFNSFPPFVDADFEIFKNIVRATRRPKKIKELAAKISSIIKFEKFKVHKFAAFHWRYDLEDWADERKDQTLKSKLLSIRKHPKVLVDFIQKALEERKISTLVIFSPPNDAEFCEEIRRLMKNINVYTEKEIVELFRSDFDKIDTDSEVSLLEQEICLLSDFFFYSEHSTWSINVLLERLLSEKQDHIYNLDFDVKKECDYNSPLLIGSVKDNMNLIDPVSRDTVLENRGSDLAKGGCYVPKNCESQQRVAIVIPYKDREENLLTTLLYLHPMLQRQEISYCVFVVEQFDDGRFNKGLVMNSGFLEIQKSFGEFDCFVFHDVDMVPEDDRNIYLCRDKPVHLSPFIDKYQYRSHYGTDWGGVTMIKPEHYLEANGYSNMFWGWGFEDSDMEFRLKEKGLAPVRPVNEENARYSMIEHDHPWRFQNDNNDIGSAGKITAKDKLRLAKEERASWDGINNTKYKLDHIVEDPLFTKIFVDVRAFEVDNLQVVIDESVLEISQKPGNCTFKNFDHTYLDPRYFIRLKKYKVYYDEETAREKCVQASQICAGITRMRNAGGKDWYMREKAILVTPDEFRFKDSVPDFIQSQVKICEGEMFNVFPLLSSVKNGSYKSKLSLKFHHAIATSLIYRDIVIFEGKPTGINNEHSLKLNPEDTKMDFSFSFETPYFALPKISGWYSVRAMITDRFEQIWFEWSFQFHVDDESTNSTAQRLEYIEQIDEMLVKYKEQSPDIKWSQEEKDAVRKAYSHGNDLL